MILEIIYFATAILSYLALGYAHISPRVSITIGSALCCAIISWLPIFNLLIIIWLIHEIIDTVKLKKAKKRADSKLSKWLKQEF